MIYRVQRHALRRRQLWRVVNVKKSRFPSYVGCQSHASDSRNRMRKLAKPGDGSAILARGVPYRVALSVVTKPVKHPKQPLAAAVGT